MKNLTLYSHEYKELRKSLDEHEKLISKLFPDYISVSFLVDVTGKSRQAVRQYLHRNCVPDVEYFVKNGKIVVVKETAIQILARS